MHASLGANEDLMRVVNALRQERPDIQIHTSRQPDRPMGVRGGSAPSGKKAA